MSKSPLLEKVRDRMRLHHYSLRTEESYIQWIKRYILFHGKRHPAEMGEPEITAFLTFLAVKKDVAASTQNQALAAILFLYKQVLNQELDWMDDIVRARRPARIPEVLTPEQVRALLKQLTGVHQLVARLLYGTGMRLMEAIRLRVGDINFGYRQITVRSGKGEKDRVTVLPDSLINPLQVHLARVRSLHERDLAEGFGRVYLPHALERKYPNANRESRVAVAVRVSVDEALRGSHLACHPPPSFGREKSATSHQAGGSSSGLSGARDFSHLPALFCHPSARKRTGHPYRSGIARSRRRENHHDLHARAQTRRARGKKSAGPDGVAATRHGAPTRWNS